MPKVIGIKLKDSDYARWSGSVESGTLAGLVRSVFEDWLKEVNPSVTKVNPSAVKVNQTPQTKEKTVNHAVQSANEVNLPVGVVKASELRPLQRVPEKYVPKPQLKDTWMKGSKDVPK